jgi:hypothetical protein
MMGSGSWQPGQEGLITMACGGGEGDSDLRCSRGGLQDEVGTSSSLAGVFLGLFPFLEDMVDVFLFLMEREWRWWNVLLEGGRV